MLYYVLYPIFFTLFRIAIRVLARLKSSGEQNVPATGGVIYCPNHLSDSDPVAMLVTAPRRAWYIGKEELFHQGLASWLFRELHGFPIKRDSADRASLRRAENLLKRGEPLVLFPEGRCAQDGVLQRIQPGAALLALRARAPIIPVGIRFTNQLLPYGTLVPRFTRNAVTVEYAPPIRPEDFDHLPKSARIDAMTRRLAEELARLVDQHVPPTDR